MVRKDINAFAASTAFFLFISLIPMLILLCAIIPFTPLTEANLMRAVTDITPDHMDSLMINIISDVYDKSAGVLSVAIIGTLWSAGKGVLALMRGLNAVNDVDESRNTIVLRVIASIYTVIILVIMLLSLFIMVFGNVWVKYLLDYVPQLNAVTQFLVHFRFLIVWAIITVGMALVYAYMPEVKTKFIMQLPGSVLVCIAWSCLSWGFSVYVDTFNGFSTYGSLTTIVMIMIWLYLCMYIILIGAHFNKYFRPAYLYFLKKRKNRKKRS